MTSESSEWLSERIARRLGIDVAKAQCGIDIAIEKIAYFTKGPPPPGEAPIKPPPPIKRKEIVRLIASELGISVKDAGILFALFISEVTYIAHENGIRSVLEFEGQ